MLAVATASVMGLTGCCECRDVMYGWNAPESQADCPDGTVYRDEATDETGEQNGGSSIVDRNGGSGIVDRWGEPVKQHCYKECASGETPVGHTIIDWHNDGDVVVAGQICAIGGSE